MKKKVLMTILAVLLVAAISVAGTLAYLQANSNTVTNTFTAAGGGNIIDDGPTPPDPIPPANAGFWLAEHEATFDATTAAYELGSAWVLGNTYDKVVPQMRIAKDPKLTINVTDGVAVYVYVKIANEASGTSAVSYTIASGWTAVPGRTDLYYREVIGAAGTELDAVSVFSGDQVTVGNFDAATAAASLGSLSVTAYVCQQAGFESPAAAFTACFPGA